MLSTDKQTDKVTNATKNITSFAKEVMKEKKVKHDNYIEQYCMDSV